VARAGRVALWVLCAAVTACGDNPATAPTPLTATSVAVEADSGAFSTTLEITLSAASGVQVDYWTDAAPRLRVIRPDPQPDHSVFLPGLRAGQVYDYEIRAFRRGLAGASLYQGQLSTDTLPSDLAALHFSSLGTPTFRLTMLELRGTPFSGYVIVDQDGAVVWFRRGIAESFARRANGDFVLLDGSTGLTEVRPDLTVVASLPNTDDLAMHHDVIRTPANTLLFLAHDTTTFQGEIWQTDAIWEWDPDAGSVTRRWRAADFLSPGTDFGPHSSAGDWLHANSLALGPRGNVLISLPALNQIISIAPDYRSLEWRLGGPNATIVPDASAEFWFEHTAAEIAPDRVLIFDNGRDRPSGHFSRGLELQLDRDKGTATVAWEFRPQPTIYAPIVGSSRRLATGHTVVSFGLQPGILGSTGPIAAYEVTDDGQVGWILRVTGGQELNYRSTALDDIAGETVVAKDGLGARAAGSVP